MSIQDELDSLIEKLSAVGGASAAGETAGSEAGGDGSGDATKPEGSSVPPAKEFKPPVVRPFRAGATLSAGSSTRGDAIDMVLNSPGRETGVLSLRDAPEVTAFRAELVNGMIRADTANQLLRLVNEVITRLL